MAQEPRRPDTLEVELKYPVTDLQTLQQRLEASGASNPISELESDIYYSPPDRNFAVTDEALRLRRTRERLWLTYKGPRCDPQSKTRQEIEIELRSPAFFDQACALLEHLGYRPIATLYKERMSYDLQWRGYPVKIALDTVYRLGTFVELETQAPATELTEARTALEDLAQQLGLERPEHRSYLELYLDALRRLPPDDLPPFV